MCWLIRRFELPKLSALQCPYWLCTLRSLQCLYLVVCFNWEIRAFHTSLYSELPLWSFAGSHLRRLARVSRRWLSTRTARRLTVSPSGSNPLSEQFSLVSKLIRVCFWSCICTLIDWLKKKTHATLSIYQNLDRNQSRLVCARFHAHCVGEEWCIAFEMKTVIQSAVTVLVWFSFKLNVSWVIVVHLIFSLLFFISVRIHFREQEGNLTANNF